jgi:hypothetical protein
MKITIEIKTDNAAFEERYEHQLAEILSDASYRIVCGETEGSLRDINGNRVGTFTVKGK